jgi:hypothetical protein
MAAGRMKGAPAVVREAAAEEGEESGVPVEGRK